MNHQITLSSTPATALPMTTSQGGSFQNRLKDSACPHRLIQRSQQKTHHGGVDSGQRCLGARALPQPLPERQNAHDQHERRRKNSQQTHHAAYPCGWRGAHRRAEERRKREQGARHRLRSAVARQKGFIADPTGRHDFRLQQRQQHMATAKNHRPGAKKRIHHGHGLTRHQPSQHRQPQ